MAHLDRRQAISLAIGASFLVGAPPGKTAGTRGPIRLSLNENPWGPGPKARAAVAAAIDDGCRYGGEYGTRLIAAIAALEGVATERVVLGSGSGELLHMLALGWATRGTVSCAWPTFGQLMAFAEKVGAEVRKVPLDAALRHDLDALDAATPSGTGLLYLCNPNNPTGTYIPFSEVQRLHAGLPKHVLLVLDGAYAEYVTKPDYRAGMELVTQYENVVITHTFSKIHGLALLRVGWCHAPVEVADALNRIRGPFNANGPAMEAAIAAIGDVEFEEQSRAHNSKWLDWLTTEIRKLGLRVTPSVGNFILVHFSEEKGRTAADADAFLTKRGLILRLVSSYGFPNALRLTVGTEEANHLVVQALADFLGGKE